MHNEALEIDNELQQVRWMTTYDVDDAAGR